MKKLGYFIMKIYTCNLKGLKYTVFIPAFTKDLIPKTQKLVRGIINHTEDFYNATKNLKNIYIDHK